MKRINLNNGTLELPEGWHEMTMAQRLQGFEWLRETAEGRLTPFEWQAKMLLLLTGYKPSRRQLTPQERETVNENLVRLAELLDFAFSIEEEAETAILQADHQIPKRWRLNYDMNDCPVRCKTYFRRERIIETNMTARQYSEGTQLLQAVREAADEEERNYYTDKLCALMGVEDCEEHWLPTVRFAMTVWFTGVVMFWQRHPVYSVLYESVESQKPQAEGNDGRITLGLQEVVLELTERGYAHAGEMLLPDFFDAQVKMLRDRLQEAKAQGVALPELSQRTGIPLHNLNRLL